MGIYTRSLIFNIHWAMCPIFAYISWPKCPISKKQDKISLLFSYYVQPSSLPVPSPPPNWPPASPHRITNRLYFIYISSIYEGKDLIVSGIIMHSFVIISVVTQPQFQLNKAGCLFPLHGYYPQELWRSSQDIGTKIHAWMAYFY